MSNEQMQAEIDRLTAENQSLRAEVERLRGQYSGPVVHQDLSEADRGLSVREAPAPGFMQPNGTRR